MSRRRPIGRVRPQSRRWSIFWNRSFASSEGISWLAVPGQITLSGVPLETPEKHLVDDDFVRSSSLEPADLDGDGDLDLVGSAWIGNQIRWWRNDGGRPPVWTEVLIESGFAGASSVRAGNRGLRARPRWRSPGRSRRLDAYRAGPLADRQGPRAGLSAVSTHLERHRLIRGAHRSRARFRVDLRVGFAAVAVSSRPSLRSWAQRAKKTDEDPEIDLWVIA